MVHATLSLLAIHFRCIVSFELGCGCVPAVVTSDLACCLCVIRTDLFSDSSLVVVSAVGNEPRAWEDGELLIFDDR